jgi:Zn-finger nucleic acid-binding protein
MKRGKLMCPKYCKVPLEQITVNGVEVDQCPKCEGVWFDSEGDELMQILRAGYDNLPAQLKKSWREGGGKLTLHNLANFHCPRCGSELSTYWYMKDEGGKVLKVDGCLKNNCGLWLDDGELGLAFDLVSFVTPELLIESPKEDENLVHRILKFLAGHK